jgi:hypothetical protein
VSGRPLGPWDRLLSWIVTGPVGRVLAFFADLSVYIWRSVRGRTAERGQR